MKKLVISVIFLIFSFLMMPLSFKQYMEGIDFPVVINGIWFWTALICVIIFTLKVIKKK